MSPAKDPNRPEIIRTGMCPIDTKKTHSEPVSHCSEKEVIDAYKHSQKKKRLSNPFNLRLCTGTPSQDQDRQFYSRPKERTTFPSQKHPQFSVSALRSCCVDSKIRFRNLYSFLASVVLSSQRDGLFKSVSD